jgi:DNA-binding GntR family transcriptional regulator
MTPPNESLSADVFETLKRRIIHWEYPPGHRFTEEAIGDEFDVSRSPVREALRMLAENNLIEKVPRRGYRVKQPDFDEIRELYDVRLALELFIVEQLAREGMPEQEWESLHRMWEALLRQQPAEDDDMASADEAFHETLAHATSNRTLQDLLHSVNERIRFVRMADFIAAERRRDTCLQHLRILDAIAARDGAAAREAMRQNIELGRMNVETAVKEALAKAYMEQGPRS